MIDFEIITDGTANLPNDLIEKCNVKVVPVPVIVNGELFGEKGIDLKEFYDKVRKKENVSTSCIGKETFVEVFQPVLNCEKDILYIAFSSALSATYENASSAAKQLKEQYPNRKIIVVDSLAASMGEGLLVYYAAMFRDEGLSIDDVAGWLEDNKQRLAHWFTVEDLYWLFKGGRVKATSYLLANILNIKPVLHCDSEGKLTAVGKVMGRKKSILALLDKMVETVENPEEQVVFIGHGDCIEDAEFLKKKILERMPVKDFVIYYIDAVIGAHSGPGTLAVFFLGTGR